MRLTIKRLTKIIDEMFQRYELDFRVKKIEKTRFRMDDYHAGACTYYVWVTRGEEDSSIMFMLFNWLNEMERMIAEGYSPCLTFKCYGTIDDEIVFKRLAQ